MLSMAWAVSTEGIRRFKSRSWIGPALGALAALASAPASAMTRAECKQQYAAHKAVGQNGGQSEADYLRICLSGQKTSGDPEPNEPGHDADTDLAKKTENPIADLISVPFDNYATFNYRNRGTFDLLEIQPVIPIHLTPDWNLITRTVLPVVWTPDLSPVPSVPIGTAPTDFSAFLTPKNETNGWLWGVGSIVQIPTISSADLGSSVWGGGPTAVIVHTGEKIVAGALVNTIWSFGGTKGLGGNSYNTSLFEPFINYNFGHGWFVYSDPNIIANWQARGTKWTVPLGGGGGRIVHVGKLPIKSMSASSAMSCSRQTADAGY
jgi:hypothetical protein